MASKISNFISKILLAMLLFLMIAGVAVWGINDIIGKGGDNTVAKVGNTRVSAMELEQATRAKKAQLTSKGMNLGSDFDVILRNNALVNIIGDKLLQNEFEHLNMKLDGKEVLKRDYLSQPDFDKDNLKGIMMSQGGEEAFLKRITKEKKIDILQGSITSILPVSDTVISKVYDFEKQSKSIDYIELSVDMIKNIPNPNDEEIKGFYESNKDKFITPEYRSASYIVIDQGSLGERKNNDIVESLHEMSNEVMDKVAGGATLEEIAIEYKLEIKKLEPVNAEGVNENGLLISELPRVDNFIAALNSTEQGEISDVLEAKDSKTYAFLRVDTIKEQRVKPLEEVKDLVIDGVKTQKKAQEMLKVSQQLQTDLDEKKTTLEDFAKKYDLTIKHKNGITNNTTDLPAESVKEILVLKKGDYTKIAKTRDNHLLVAKVTETSKANKPSKMELYDYQLKIQEQLSQEIMAEYLDYLKEKYRVAVYSEK